MKGWSLCVM